MGTLRPSLSDSMFMPAAVDVQRQMTPTYWQQASVDLAKADPVLAQFVEHFAGGMLVSRGDPFATLVRSIVGQVGQPLRMWRGGRWTERPAWGGVEHFD